MIGPLADARGTGNAGSLSRRSLNAGRRPACRRSSACSRQVRTQAFCAVLRRAGSFSATAAFCSQGSAQLVAKVFLHASRSACGSPGRAGGWRPAAAGWAPGAWSSRRAPRACRPCRTRRCRGRKRCGDEEGEAGSVHSIGDARNPRRWTKSRVLASRERAQDGARRRRRERRGDRPAARDRRRRAASRGARGG